MECSNSPRTLSRAHILDRAPTVLWYVLIGAAILDLVLLLALLLWLGSRILQL